MPDPAAFFSFGKLLSAFTGSGLDSSSNFAKQVDPAPIEQRSVDVESVKGIPILKDEDQEPVVVQRTEDELPAAHSLESNESHQTEDETTSTPELIIFTLPTDTEESTTIETTTKSDKDEDSGNLLGNLLSGKKVDWIGSIFGSNKRDKQTGEDGNALAQLFGNGFFGSAMNDDDSTKQRKHEDRNFFLMS
ncbi:hypothetical protein M3Y97_00144700 [Aphelenchoides bicaudatus]|nr:hypothetical protein M3Y97_00144700 [Aphelenchoides bicaudatus]